MVRSSRAAGAARPLVACRYCPLRGRAGPHNLGEGRFGRGQPRRPPSDSSSAGAGSTPPITPPGGTSRAASSRAPIPESRPRMPPRKVNQTDRWVRFAPRGRISADRPSRRHDPQNRAVGLVRRPRPEHPGSPRPCSRTLFHHGWKRGCLAISRPPGREGVTIPIGPPRRGNRATLPDLIIVSRAHFRSRSRIPPPGAPRPPADRVPVPINRAYERAGAGVVPIDRTYLDPATWPSPARCGRPRPAGPRPVPINRT